MDDDFPLTSIIRYLPEAEHPDAHAILMAVDGLRGIVGAFTGALSLFNFCQHHIAERTRLHLEAMAKIPEPPHGQFGRGEYEAKSALREKYERDTAHYRAWSYIAGREGAMRIYDLEIAMQEIVSEIRIAAPTLHAMTDTKVLREARRSLSRALPDAKDIRDGTGHTQLELSTTDKKRERHGADLADPKNANPHVTGSGTGTIITGMRVDTYTITIRKRIRSYRLNESSLNALRDAKDMFVKGFNGAREYVNRQIESERAARRRKTD